MAEYSTLCRLIVVKEKANFVKLFRSNILLSLIIENTVQSIFNYAVELSALLRRVR